MSDYPQYQFDPKTLRYRDLTTGKFVKQSLISPLLIESYITQQASAVSKITKSLLAGDIGLNVWEDSIAAELKKAHISAYSLGLGGIKKLTERDKNLITKRLLVEYTHLRKFTESIANGELTSKQIEYRISLYVKSLYQSYQQGRDIAAQVSGKTWERWIRNRSAESCDDCIKQENLNWQRIGTLPTIGSQKCLVNCRCHKVYNDSIQRPTDMLSSSFGWI